MVPRRLEDLGVDGVSGLIRGGEVGPVEAEGVAEADEADDNIAFDRMSEEDLLAGIEGLVPPEKSDDY